MSAISATLGVEALDRAIQAGIIGVALVMLFIGGLAAYTVVWDLGDVGIGLMTIFNMLALVPLSGEALTALNDYEKRKKIK